MSTSELLERLAALEKKLRDEKRHRLRVVEKLILEEAREGGFYPAYPITKEMWDLGFNNGQLRRIADRMVKQGVLMRHKKDGYDSEKGRELGLVFYTLAKEEP